MGGNSLLVDTKGAEDVVNWEEGNISIVSKLFETRGKDSYGLSRGWR